MRHICDDVQVVFNTRQNRIEEACNFMLTDFFIIDSTHSIIHTGHCSVENYRALLPVAKTLRRAYFDILDALDSQLKLGMKSWSDERKNNAYIHRASVGLYQRMLNTFHYLLSVEFVVWEEHFFP